MKIWIMESELEPYKGYYLQTESDLEIIKKLIDKKQKIDKWTPLGLISDNKNKETSDTPYFWPYTNLLMVSERAKGIIENKYLEYIQFLPVVDLKDNRTYYMANIMSFLDGIDKDKSEFEKLLGVHVVDVIKYVLKENVKNAPIFRLYLQGVLMRTKIFVNDEFKRLIEDSKLKGFKFTEIFDFES